MKGITMATMLELLRSKNLTAEQLEEIAQEAGLSVEDAQDALERREKKLAYRKDYNARPHRKAKRKLYNLVRTLKEKKATAAFSKVIRKEDSSS